MLHGFPQDHSCWDSWVAPLSRDGYRVIRIDQRGYSPGARPRRVSDYRLAESVADAVALLDVLGIDRVHVIGHDWGGAVAWGLASSHPDRLASVTILSTPHPEALLRAIPRSRQLAMSWYMLILQWPGLARRVVAPGGPAWPALMRGLPRSSRSRYEARARDPQAFDSMIAWYRAMFLDVIRPSVDWGPIAVPTLYAWGRRDPALGVQAAQRSGELVRGRYEFVVLVGHGHWLAERAGQTLVPKVLEHLRHQDSPRTDLDRAVTEDT